MQTQPSSIDSTQDRRPRIWIYGDSFAVPWRKKGWVYLLGQALHHSHRIVCRADGGTSVSDCCWRFHGDRRRALFHKDDRVIWVWSERLRLFNNRDLLRRHHALWPEFRDTWLSYPALIRDCVAEMQVLDMRCLSIWAFPSSYPGCLDPDDDHKPLVMVHQQPFLDLRPDQYRYIDTSAWVDEIRPALWWYSHREQQQFMDMLEKTYPNIADRARLVSRGLPRDQRPNHIADPALHQRLAESVSGWVRDQWRGILDLENLEVNSKT